MHSSINRLTVTLCILGVLAAGCAGQSRTEAPATGGGTTTAPTTTTTQPSTGKLLLLRDVPHVTQKTDFCGEACAEMVLRKLGKKITQNEVFNASELDPMLGRGCYTADLRKALRKIGFAVGDVFYYVPAAQADKGMKRQFDALLAVESTKAASDVFAPVGGEVAEVNEALEDEPELVNQDPYGKGWMVKLKGVDASQTGQLMDSDAYADFEAGDEA